LTADYVHHEDHTKLRIIDFEPFVNFVSFVVEFLATAIGFEFSQAKKLQQLATVFPPRNSLLG